VLSMLWCSRCDVLIDGLGVGRQLRGGCRLYDGSEEAVACFARRLWALREAFGVAVEV
jgi:hypothetical protein